MRALKFGAIASVSLLMVICVLVGYLFMTAEVQVVEIKAEGIPATEQLQTFENIKTAIEENTFYGTIFQKPREWKDASEYVFINYTVRVSNNCLVPIDMIEVQIIPQSFDILQLPDLSVKSLDLKSEGDVQVCILAPKDTHPIREMIVTYYLWGVSGTVKAVYSN